MKRPFLPALTAGAVLGLLALTPAFAQATGNPGDLHAQTQQYRALRGYTARAPDPAKPGCRVIHDFNTSQTHYQYIAVCPMRPLL